GGSNHGGASGGIAVDSACNAYVAGHTLSSDFPVLNAFQPTHAGGVVDVTITKLDAAGQLAYATYLGGSGADYGYGISVDGVGSVYVSGNTYSTDFPVLNSFQPTYAGGTGGDAFITKLDATGALSYSTYLGGSSNDTGIGTSVDGGGNAYVTGHTNSSDFPTMQALQPVRAGADDAFITKLDASGMLSYSTYLGGVNGDVGWGIDSDGNGNVYVTGKTYLGTFPTTPNAYQPNFGGSFDAFVTKISASNQPPVADAGVAQTVECTGSSSANSTLNGSASSDPDGDTLAYAWFWISGSATGVNPTALFPLGTTIVTLTVDDGNGHTATATTTVTVQDTTAPTVNAGADVVIEATNATGEVFDVLTQATLTDSCCGVSSTVAPAGPYALGATTVTVMGTDCSGNSASDPMIVTVQDTTPPVLTVPADVSVEANAVLSTVALGTATATDIFGATVTNNAPATFPVGTTVVTYTATDGNGLVTTGTQNVTVVDTTAPTVTAQLIPVSGGHDEDEDEHSEGMFQVVLTATDIADPNPVLVATLNGVTVTNGQIVELNQSKKAKSEFEHGKLEIKGMSFSLDVAATDASGNTGNASTTFAFPPKHDGDDKDHGDKDHDDKDRHSEHKGDKHRD
ncbi:MAG: SBBP repeat-containing protein, partial [Mariprofundus sp.]